MAYPLQAIELQVPFAAGSMIDRVGRVVAPTMREAWGQPVSVVNKAGSGGVPGTVSTLSAQADGYTLGMGSLDNLVLRPAIDPATPYHPATDLTPIMIVAEEAQVLVVHPNFPAKTHAAFVQELRANPSSYSYASAGVGTHTHMLAELYKSATGTRVAHVPYRGTAPAVVDVVGGKVLIYFGSLPNVWPQIQRGQLVPLAVAASRRPPQLPDVPTFQELGLQTVNRSNYYGVIGPKGMPAGVAEKIQAAIVAASGESSYLRRSIETADLQVVASTPAEFDARIQADYAAFRGLVTQQGLTPE